MGKHVYERWDVVWMWNLLWREVNRDSGRQPGRNGPVSMLYHSVPMHIKFCAASNSALLVPEIFTLGSVTQGAMVHWVKVLGRENV